MRLTITQSDVMEDWYLIERETHDGRTWLEPMPGGGAMFMTSSRFSDADVEGHADQMLAIADAIEQRQSVRFKRCAVRVDGQRVFFCSPRNSQREGECTLEEADELVKVIRERIPRPQPVSIDLGE